MLLIAQHGNQQQCVPASDKANRHGLITGATGTGKTITLQTMAEGFSRIGVPVFMADIKGDLTGISSPAALGAKAGKDHYGARAASPEFAAFPTTLWDVLANRATRCAPPSATWGRCCWPACSI
jgi:DNA helicase HerA-like ATPase